MAAQFFDNHRKLLDKSSPKLRIERKRRRHLKIYYAIGARVFSLVHTYLPILYRFEWKFLQTRGVIRQLLPHFHPLDISKRVYTNKTILCVRVLFLSSEKQSPVVIKNIQVYYYFYFICYTLMLQSNKKYRKNIYIF